MRYAALGELALLLLLTAFTCSTNEVKNSTSKPILVNLASSDASEEYEGYLLQPGESRSVANYGESVRVRNLAGETILFARGTSSAADDASYDVTSLAPDPKAPPLGRTFIWGLGYDSPWSATICDNGKERNVPQFGMLVTVKNRSDQPLVLSHYERFADTREESDVMGFLAPASGTAYVYGEAIFEPWLRAFGADGSLVYAAPLEFSQRQTIEIPRELQPTPPDIPPQQVDRSLSACRSWTDWVIPGVIALLLLPLVLLFALFWMGMAFVSYVVLAPVVFVVTVLVELVT